MRWDIRLPVQCDAYLDRTTEQVRLHSGRTNRPDLVRNLKTALSVILANLFRCHQIDENRYVKILASNRSYTSGRMNPLGLSPRIVRTVLDYLNREDLEYVQRRGGNFDRIRGITYTRRYRAARRLIEEIEGSLAEDERFVNQIPLTRNTLDNRNPIQLLSSFQISDLPLLRLRGGAPQRSYLQFDATAETRRMEANLTSINRYVHDHWIDLLVSDREFRTVTTQHRGEPENSGDEREAGWDIDLFLNRSLYRVFNNGSFDQGGRFYGGWWQMVPRAARRYLTINWYPTAELDFSNMQIAMLYAREGLALEGDAYEIQGVDPLYRPLIKRTLLQVINAVGRFRPPPRVALPPGWNFAQLLEGIETKHAAIARHFRTGIGIQLQRTDADIAERIMLTLLEENILALPVHDSFVVEDGRQGRLEEVMRAIYQEYLGQDVAISADPTMFQELPRDDAVAQRFGYATYEAYRIALAEDGIRSFEDDFTEIEGREGYEGYWARKQEVLRWKGEAWRHSHRFLN